MNGVHVIVPDGVADPGRPSGGNIYDRRIIDGLVRLGWSVHVHEVGASWPHPTDADRRAVAVALATIPGGRVVVIDGLVATLIPDLLVPESARLREVVLVHLPLGDDGVTSAREKAVLSAASAVVTTSAWTGTVLRYRYGLPSARLHVVRPGVDDGELAPGTPEGSALLCVGTMAPHKGQDVLLDAGALIDDLPWRCCFVGARDRNPGFAETLAYQAHRDGIADRLRFSGVLSGSALDAAYAAADVLVLPSHGETYGMVVAEALAHGLPVIASLVGGVPEALGRGADGSLPGILVPSADPVALASALRRWLGDPRLRDRLRTTARERRATLEGWAAAIDRMARMLIEAAA